MKRIWYYLQLFFYTLRLAKNPTDTATALKLNPILIKLGCLKHSLEVVKPFSKDLPQDRYLLKKIDLQNLKTRPPGSLGAVYAEHMLSQNLNPEFYGSMKVTNAETEFLLRARQTHDLWHVLLGFSTSVEDELGLQSFLFAQIRYPLASITIGAAFIRLGLSNHPLASVVYDRVSSGWKMGLTAKNIFGLDWESNWNTPIDQLRAQYNITKFQFSRQDFRSPAAVDPFQLL